ncbi:MAG: hypothetical protein KAJ06_00500 [Gammaproteobacteria bacterium]|nr:hypothetical protein [Gammaproteobacteria bacterium]
MTRFVQFLGQAIAYSLFAVAVGYFSTRPAYTHYDPDKAVIKLSFSHAGQHVEECRRLTQDELNRLPPNMRRPTECLRARVSLLVEAEMDGQLIYREELAPSGLASDGTSTVYRKFPVGAGQHHLVVRLRDSRRTSGFDYEKSADIMLQPQQNFVIDFRPELGGFLFL